MKAGESMREGLLAIINLLFVPTISAYLYFKRDKKISKTELFLRYCISTVAIAAVSKFVCWALGWLFKVTLTAYSALYTLLAVAVAIMLPFITKAITIKVEKTKEKKEETKDDREESEKDKAA